MDWVLVHDPTCNPLNDWHFDARWEYANTIARAVNPFEPELEDEGNLSSALGVFDMFCRVYRHEENLSNFTKWFVAFFDASVKGGAVYEGIMFAASMLPFPSPAMVAKLGATLAKMGRAVIGAMQKLWKGIKAVGGALKTTITTIVTKVAGLGANLWHNPELVLFNAAEWAKGGVAKFSRGIKGLASDPDGANKMRLALGCTGAVMVVCMVAKHPTEMTSWTFVGFAGGLLGSVKGSWKSLIGKVIKVGEEEFEIGFHAAKRMGNKRIPESDVEQALGTRPFSYEHEGVTKLGYYDHETTTFAGTVSTGPQSSKITTVMQGPGTYQYLVSMGWL